MAGDAWREKRRVLAARARVRLEARRLRALGHRLEIGDGGLFYDGLPKLSARGDLSFGVGLSLYSWPIAIQITAAEGARVAIGDAVGMNYGVDIFAAQEVEIGDATMIGPMASIYDTNFHPIDEDGETTTKPVRIGTNAWIARGATLLPGAEVGDHAVVAAGAVVTGEVPPRTLYGGNPGKVLREVRAGDGWRRNAVPF